MKLATTFLIALSTLASQLGTAQQYSLTLIPNLPNGLFIAATGVNSSGVVVGQSSLPNDESRGFIYSGGVTTAIPTFGGKAHSATAINDAGVVVGISEDPQRNQRAFTYFNGTLTNLGTLGGAHSGATGINASGVVTGYAWTGSMPVSEAFRYSNGAMTGLGAIGGFPSSGEAINDSGVVAGTYMDTNLDQFGFIDDGTTMTDLGSLGGGTTLVSGINNDSVVVGGSLPSAQATYVHAFSYSNGAMSDLGTLGGGYSDALAINNSGQIVGTSNLASGPYQHAFLYSSGAMLDLNDLIVDLPSTYHVESARDISDNGYIVVRVVDQQNNSVGAGLLTPVPEPVSLAAIGVGLLLLGNKRAKRATL